MGITIIIITGKKDCCFHTRHELAFSEGDVTCYGGRLLNNVVLTVARFIRATQTVSSFPDVLNIQNFKAIN